MASNSSTIPSEAKRAKLESPQTQDSGVASSSSSSSFKSTKAEVKEIEQTILIWKLSDFIKVKEVLEGHDFEWYKSPVMKFKDLSWNIEIRPMLYTPKRGLTYPTHWSSKIEEVLIECILQAENTDKPNDKEADATDKDDDREKFDCLINLATISKELNSSKVVNFLKFPNGVYYSVSVPPGACETMLRWLETKDSYDFRSCSTDYIKVTLTCVDEDMTCNESQAHFFKLQQLLIAKMKKETRGVKMFLKLIQAQNNVGEENGVQENFWIEAKCGARVGFHKGILQVRGNDHFKSYLSAGMKESLTSELKWDIFDLDTILGFKEYLYYGTVPNLKTGAFEYFKFGDYCHLDQVKELAELEICRTLGENIDKAHELTKYYSTKHLKEEIIKSWQKNPKYMERIIRLNYDVLVKVDPEPDIEELDSNSE